MVKPIIFFHGHWEDVRGVLIHRTFLFSIRSLWIPHRILQTLVLTLVVPLGK